MSTYCAQKIECVALGFQVVTFRTDFVLQAAGDMLQRLLAIKAISLEDIAADIDMQQLKESGILQKLENQQDEAVGMAS